MACKYLVFGAGFLGFRISDYLGCELSDARISCVADAFSELERFSPDYVINCIGRTGRPNIDWCETHKKETFSSNVLAAADLLMACEDFGANMVHLSSGCIYSGDNGGVGYSEMDEPNFLKSYYSRTKALSERMLSDFDVLQLRIRLPIDSISHPKNLLDKLLSFDRIICVPNSVTVVDDLLYALKKLTEAGQSGIFNVVNPQPVTHADVLNVYEELSGKSLGYEVIGECDAFEIGPRSNCTLSTKKLSSKGVELADTMDSIRACLKAYLSNSNP